MAELPGKATLHPHGSGVCHLTGVNTDYVIQGYRDWARMAAAAG